MDTVIPFSYRPNQFFPLIRKIIRLLVALLFENADKYPDASQNQGLRNTLHGRLGKVFENIR